MHVPGVYMYYVCMCACVLARFTKGWQITPYQGYSISPLSSLNREKRI